MWDYERWVLSGAGRSKYGLLLAKIDYLVRYNLACRDRWRGDSTLFHPNFLGVVRVEWNGWVKPHDRQWGFPVVGVLVQCDLEKLQSKRRYQSAVWRVSRIALWSKSSVNWIWPARSRRFFLRRERTSSCSAEFISSSWVVNLVSCRASASRDSSRCQGERTKIEYLSINKS